MFVCMRRQSDYLETLNKYAQKRIGFSNKGIDASSLKPWPAKSNLSSASKKIDKFATILRGGIALPTIVLDISQPGFVEMLDNETKAMKCFRQYHKALFDESIDRHRQSCPSRPSNWHWQPIPAAGYIPGDQYLMIKCNEGTRGAGIVSMNCGHSAKQSDTLQRLARIKQMLDTGPANHANKVTIYTSPSVAKTE